MSSAIDAILPEIIEMLRERADVGAGRPRNDSWMTAAQIAARILDIRGTVWDDDELDNALLAWWSADPSSRPLRPANYPEQSSLARLWGHKQRVGDFADQRPAERTDSPADLETLPPLPDTAKRAFISYAHPDRHFAARVRLYLWNLGLDSWIYERDLDEGAIIFDAVKAAINRSDFTIALATPHSLASAWMFTETNYSRGHSIQTIVVFDGGDRRLMSLLESWRPPITGNDDRFFDRELLSALKLEYAKYNSPDRIAKYETSTQAFLFAMSSFHKCVYPRKPAASPLHPSIADFETLILGFPGV